MSAPGLAIASDRGPVTLTSVQGRLEMERRPGSVTSLLDGAARRLPWRTLWVAPDDTQPQGSDLGPEQQTKLAQQLGYSYAPVPIGRRQYREYYDDVGVRMLWLALHGLWPDVADCGAPPPEPDTFTRSYQQVNRSVAEQIVRRTRPDTPVLIQDYQLATAPRFIRALRPRQPVGLFLHTPFSTPDELARLPRSVAGAVLEGMLAAHQIGFQSPRWVAHFLDCCEAWGYRVHRADPGTHMGGTVQSPPRSGSAAPPGVPHTTAVACYPVPADSALLATNAQHAQVRSWEREFALDPAARHIVRVDRIDPSKNILRGLEAYEIVLERSAALRERLVMTACLTPSRERIPEYRLHADRIHHMAQRLNHRFPGCLRVYLGHDVSRCLAALKSYDVLLVNPLRDGMNLVSQEGPQLNTRHGALVLSRAAGSSDRLAHLAELVEDPRDVVRTARALENALALRAEERRRRASGLRAAVAGGDPALWLSQQVRELEQLARVPQPGGASP
ncbi:trehalose-6-phosphate synthase [Streptomyces sp. NPDC059991]|uniref:trehalose-6-phosphate synthase n=1 Tax=unclassified Streptomyces TaxID=2593676 RepID=UPI00367B8E9F